MQVDECKSKNKSFIDKDTDFSESTSIAVNDEMTNKKTQLAWKSICIAHLTRCVCDRSYSFFLPLYISKFCHGSFRPTAALSIVQNITVALLSTSVANVYKSSSGSSKSAFVISTAIENVAVALGGIFISLFVGQVGIDDKCNNPLSSHYFKFSLILGAIDAVSFELMFLEPIFHKITLGFTTIRYFQVFSQ